MDEYIKLFGAVAAALITATVGQTLAFFWTRRSAKIKLKLNIDNSIQCLPISLQKDYNNGRGPRDRRFVRLKLFNHSPHGAVSKDTSVVLHEITDVTNGRRSIPYPNPQPLLWNEEGKQRAHAKKAIPHGGPQYIDLLYVEDDPSQVHVVLKDNNYNNVGLAPGHTYKFKVQATALEAKSITKTFKVKLGERYDDIIVVKWWHLRKR
jgi:hypothetical protein